MYTNAPGVVRRRALGDYAVMDKTIAQHEHEGSLTLLECVALFQEGVEMFTERLARFERIVDKLLEAEDKLDRQRRPYGDGYRPHERWLRR
jgi:hypothetical protein